MNRTIVMSAPWMKGLVFGAVLGAGALVAARAHAQWDPPPPEIIASAEPVYYERHAAYWYNNHWFWRDEHGGWNHYDREPPTLADHRAHSPPDRHSWESHGHGRR
jgi:hypothetical protein